MPTENEILQAAKEAVRMPPDFGYHGDVDLGRTWGFSPFSVHRDSDALERSNYELIVKDLEEEFPDDVSDERMNHWAVGWIDHLLIRVYDRHRNVTPAFRKAAEIAEKLSNYPVYDEEHFSRIEYEENLETLENSCWIDVPSELRDLVEEEFGKTFKDDKDADLFSMLMRKLGELGHYEYNGPGGTCPSKEIWFDAIADLFPEAWDKYSLQEEDWYAIIERALLLYPKHHLDVESERLETADFLVNLLAEYGLNFPHFEMEYLLADTRLRRYTTYGIDERQKIAEIVTREIHDRLGI